MADIFQAYDLDDSKVGDKHTHYEVMGKKGSFWYCDFPGSFATEEEALADIQARVQAGERGEWQVFAVTQRLVHRVKVDG